MMIPDWQVDDALEAKWPLASSDIQCKWEPGWREEYKDSTHNVYDFGAEIVGVLHEDGHQGPGLYVWRATDPMLDRSMHYIDTRRAGWSIRLSKLLRTLK